MTGRVALTCGNRARVGPYTAALEAAGLVTEVLTAERPQTLAGFAGLVLSGGADVNPSLYGQPGDPRTQTPDDARDAMEIALVREALDAGVPVLAICRGAQLLNVALGGTLIQHVEDHACKESDHAAPVHDVVVHAGTLLAAIVGAGRLPVNSRHHQAVDAPAPGLVVTARSVPDSIVEALEHPGHRFVVAVQWHPEDQAQTNLRQRKLFEAFARAVGITEAACGSAR